MGYEYENHLGEFKGSLERVRHPRPKRFEADYEHIGNEYYGVEYKSPVAPLAYHKRRLSDLLACVDFNMNASGSKNHGGIHVSVSKSEGDNVDRVFKFLHSRGNTDLFYKLSRRSAQSYATYCPSHGREAWRWHDYYGIITKRKPRAYELRLFAAHPELILPSLEMADSLFSLAREDQVTMETWTNYIRDKRKYREIHQEVSKCRIQ